MTKLVYRGYDNAANDNAPVSAKQADLVYRGVHYDRKDAVKGAHAHKKAQMIYRGAAA